MISRRTYRLLVAALLPAFAAAEEPPMLDHNPFTRPPSKVTVAQDVIVESADGSTVMLDLRATLVGARDRFANVADYVLRPGDEIQGFRLTEIYEDRAVFIREGKSLTVYVKPEQEASDE